MEELGSEFGRFLGFFRDHVPITVKKRKVMGGDKVSWFQRIFEVCICKFVCVHKSLSYH
jgi:hypothetical protein